MNEKALVRMRKASLTDEEKNAIQTCHRHKTEFAILFGKDILFDETMPDICLQIMMTVSHQRLLSEIQKLTETKDIETALTCLRYLNACLRIEIEHAKNADEKQLRDMKNYIEYRTDGKP